MKTLKISVLLALAAALAWSCEIPFALDDVSEPALYVQYIPAGGGNAPGMKLAYADPAFGKDSGKRYPFSTADIHISVNGTEIPLDGISIETDGNMATLKPGCRFAPGDKVVLRVDGHGVQGIQAETTVPEIPEIASVALEKVQRDSSDATRVVMKLPRDAVAGEYYGLKTALRTTTVTMKVSRMPSFPTAAAAAPLPVKTDTSVTVFYSSAGQIASTADLGNLDLDAFASISYQNGFISAGFFSGEPLMLLSSNQFTGSEYSFYVNSFDSFDWADMDFDFDPDIIDDSEEPQPEDPENPEDPEQEEEPYFSVVIASKQEISLELYRLSDELYNYCKAQYLSSFNMLSNFGVTPPNFTYSNIIGGLGIVGALSVNTTDWQLLSEYELSTEEIMALILGAMQQP